MSSLRSSTGAHLAALLTVGIWGTTFVSTKVLLTGFSPAEILFFRFLIGYAALLLAWPRILRGVSAKREAMFAAAGLCGVCLYYLLENIALTYTLASSVGVIVSAAPFFTALFSVWLLKESRPGAVFFVGFAAAIIGIGLISWSGTEAGLNPVGDLLSLLAAIVWAIYSILVKKIAGFGYPVIAATRRIFFYGILFMVPCLFWLDFSPDFSKLADPAFLFNILFLGLGASALCFVTWNYAVTVLGAVKTSIYIYLTPVITAVTSALVLHEKITQTAWLGICLTIAGLVLSERAGRTRKAGPGTGRVDSTGKRMR